MPIPIESRKKDHIELAVKKPVDFARGTGLEDVHLPYACLPEIDLDEVDLSVRFLGKRFAAPLMVSGMTGGTARARKINHDIARAVEEAGLGMGLGSQRAMLEKPRLAATYRVRDIAPTLFLAANLGIAQIDQYPPEKIQALCEEVGADALAVHANAAQEAVQPEGDTRFSGKLAALKKLVRALKLPVYLKEVGHGVSGAVAKKLAKTGVQAIDVQGAGGTSWTAIESYRGNTGLGKTYWDVGIPTAASIAQCKKHFPGPVLASGGLRTGLDIVKGLLLGASLGVVAAPVIRAQQRKGYAGVRQTLQRLVQEIRVGFFLCGARNLKELHKKKPVVLGRAREWLEHAP